MKVPVIREDREDSPHVIEPSSRLSGTIATLHRPKRDIDGDGDWQTITTDRPIDPPNLRTGAIFNGAGSSVADVSDVSWQHFYQTDHGSTDRIVQNPFADACSQTPPALCDDQTNRHLKASKLPNPHPAGFLPNASRAVPAHPSRAAAAIRLFSSTFKRDSTLENPKPRFIEMNNFGHSYESLSSEQALQNMEVETGPWQPTNFRWSRIQNNLGRSPPKAPLTVFDQPLYRPEIAETNPVRETSHVPHDEFLNEIPRLPFPLISLPEAAMLQHFRRERGEEDHTETVSFTSKPRSCTMSTVSSSQPPWTPVSPDFGRHSGYSAYVPKPAPVHCGSRSNENRSFRLSKLPP